jgi:glycosyltransferase involved in cell wall biosynthesis
MIQTIAYFIDSTPGTGVGGAEQVMLHIWTALDRSRWRPILFHYAEPGLATFLRAAKSLDVESREVPRIRVLRSMFTGLPRLISELQAQPTVIFHAHLNYPSSCQGGLAAAALARVPAIVATVHLFPEISLSPVTYAIQRVLAHAVDCYIGVSHDVVGRLGQTFGIPARKLRMVHNGVPLHRFDVPVNTALRATLAADVAQPIILTIGRLVQQKGHCYLLQAATRVPNAVFVLVGDGPEQRTLEAQASTLGVRNRVVFLGYREDVPDLLACADLLVLPSLFEGLPLSVLEAMAAGRPVIASDVGGTNEAIAQDQTGLLVPPANPWALAGAIRRVLFDRQLANRLAACGKARAHEEFSAATMVQSVTQIYEDVLSSS